MTGTGTIESRIGREARLRWVPLAQMRVNPLAQRDLNQARVSSLAAGFDPQKMGAPKVSHRGGWYYLIDGQHAITALIGPTGSGKTTLLRTFNRMNDKVSGYRHSGDVLLEGQSIWRPGLELMALRRKVGMLFQRPNLLLVIITLLTNIAARVLVRRVSATALPVGRGL